MAKPPAPLFRDPIYDGAADPTIIYNRAEKTWWILYTNRRANVEGPGLAWVHGTDIGIASSSDGGASWLYRGIVEGLAYEPGRNTYWAPEILCHDGVYHMYVSYVPGVPHDWSGRRHILHYTSANLWQWTFQARLPLSSEHVIDACVFQLPTGAWRMWYKDESNGSHSYTADSADLYHWQVRGPVISDHPHEGPNVFAWRGSIWMVTDTWHGQGVYRSDDAEHWEQQANILATGGARREDNVMGNHADVLVVGERAFIFYFTHPGRTTGHQTPDDQTMPYEDRRTSLQVAELELTDGVLVCDRDKDFELDLPNEG
ncbi:MAG TPA: glycosyl hydrolase [Anaerolineae bacterium]|jgi:hypothetical protein